MAAKQGYENTVKKIYNRLQKIGGFVNVFALDQGLRTLRDHDPHLKAMMQTYGKQYVGRYNYQAKLEWIKEDVEYTYKMAVR